MPIVLAYNLVSLLPTASLEVCEGEGHMLFRDHAADIWAWLAGPVVAR